MFDHRNSQLCRCLSCQFWTSSWEPLASTDHLSEPLRPVQLLLIWSDCRIPGPAIYMCRFSLKNEVYNNSCYSYSVRCNPCKNKCVITCVITLEITCDHTSFTLLSHIFHTLYHTLQKCDLKCDCCRSEWAWSERARQLSNQQRITL